MKYEEIQQRCIRLIADQKKVSPETILPDTSFEELGLDSLDRVSLAFDVEEIYQITIAESDLTTILSVKDMVNSVQAAVAMKNGHTSDEEHFA